MVFDAPLENSLQYSCALKNALHGQYEASREDLKQQGIKEGVTVTGTPQVDITGKPDVLITGQTVNVGEKDITVSGETIKLTAGGSTIEISAAGITLTSAAPVTVQGSKISLN